MKNNFLISIVLIFIFSFSYFNKVKSEELQLNANEIESLEKGNKILASNGVEIRDPKGITIKADNAEYDKIKSIIKVKNNVKITDLINNYLLSTNEAIYFVNEDKIVSKNETVIEIEEKYILVTSDITYDRKLKEIFSKNQTTIQDNNNNILNAGNFKLLIDDKVIEAKFINLIDSDSNEHNIEIAKLNLETNEIVGKDLSIKFNKEYFSENNDPRLKAKSIIIEESNSYFKKGIFTTCKIRGDKCPPWTVSAEEIHHDKSKKIINYKNAWLKIYDKPILYFPKFFHPDPTVKRQSGFLMPTLSSSNNLGNYLSVPYFYAISDNKDLTFTPRFYDKQKTLYQSEYRQANKSSDHVMDFGILNKSRLIETNKTLGTHFFVKSNFDTDINYFENSSIDLNIQQVSQDNYLKTNKIKSPIITNETVLNSKIEFEGSTKDLDLNLYTEVYEDLSKETSDRYEYIFPSYSLTKYIESSLEGELSFTSSGNSKLYDTNVYEKTMVNDLNYQSFKNVVSNGFVTNYEFLLKNSNSDSKNSKTSKNTLNQNLQSIIKYQIQYPLKKIGVKFDRVLTPILSARFSPNKSKDIKGSDRIIDYNNIFSLNRIGSSETIEGGQSITIGNEFKTIDKLGNELFSLNLATMFRDEENADLPQKSTLDRKSSNVVGEMLFKPKEFFDLKYSFSLDNDMQTLNYNLVNATFSVNNFVTSFEFLEKNNVIGDESYLSNKTTLNLSDNSSLAFNTRRNKQLGINEYYDLIYEYKNDCLKAAVEYKKSYYEDGDLKPEEQIYFSLTVIPFGTVNTPDINK
mgnify:CR=1 FL=1